MIFETHAHYDDDAFQDDREQLLAQMQSGGISRIINVGATLKGAKQSLELAGQYDFIYAAVGIHPSEIADLNQDTFAWLERQTAWDKTVAVGEIGLDYYWDKEPQVQESQREWFGRQLELARTSQLPVVIHSRDAAEDTMTVMRQHHAEDIPGVIHCYSYSKELAMEYVKMGYYIGVGGVVTFKNGRKLVQTVEAVPMERILLETDSPYMAPEPNRGTRNNSLNIPYIVEKIAQIKGVSTQEVERITEENAYRLFTKVKRGSNIL